MSKQSRDEMFLKSAEKPIASSGKYTLDSYSRNTNPKARFLNTVTLTAAHEENFRESDLLENSAFRRQTVRTVNEPPLTQRPPAIPRPKPKHDPLEDSTSALEVTRELRELRELMERREAGTRVVHNKHNDSKTSVFSFGAKLAGPLNAQSVLTGSERDAGSGRGSASWRKVGGVREGGGTTPTTLDHSRNVSPREALSSFGVKGAAHQFVGTGRSSPEKRIPNETNFMVKSISPEGRKERARARR